MTMIETSGWEHKKMRERHHEWVDLIISNSREVWEYLLRERDFAEGFDWVREQVWIEMCQAVFDAVLDGFSRVRKCSPEGRAAMSMDVDALHEGLNEIHSCHPPRGKHYVDSFIRASYMQEEGSCVCVYLCKCAHKILLQNKLITLKHSFPVYTHRT